MIELRIASVSPPLGFFPNPRPCTCTRTTQCAKHRELATPLERATRGPADRRARQRAPVTDTDPRGAAWLESQRRWKAAHRRKQRAARRNGSAHE